MLRCQLSQQKGMIIFGAFISKKDLVAGDLERDTDPFQCGDRDTNNTTLQIRYILRGHFDLFCQLLEK